MSIACLASSAPIWADVLLSSKLRKVSRFTEVSLFAILFLKSLVLCSLMWLPTGGMLWAAGSREDAAAFPEPALPPLWWLELCACWLAQFPWRIGALQLVSVRGGN